MQRIAFILIPLMLASCGIYDTANLNYRQDSLCGTPEATTVFQKEVYPLFKNKCASCHGGGQAPLFAQQNLNGAMTSTLQSVNFSNISESRLIVKVDQGHNCGADCQSLSSNFKKAIANWAAVQGAAPVECNADPVAPDPLGGAYRLMLSAKSFSNTAAMPAANVNGGNVIVRWNISNATLGTASVQVNWKISLAPSDNNKGTFTISDIRVGSTTRTLKVKDIRLHINGQESKTFTAFSKVDQVIAPIANGVPTNETQSLNQNFRLIAPTGGQIMTETIPFENDTDSLALEFKVLGDSNSIATPIPEDVDPTTLPEPQLYLAVADILYTRCYSCHQSINQFRLTQNAANDRATIISKTSVANPANSLLLRKGTGLEVNHGEYIVRSTEAGMREYNLILAWISKLPAN